MNQRLKILIMNLKQIFSTEIIENISRKTGFTKRKSKLTPEIFLSLCTFWGKDLCTSSLTQLHSKLKANENLSISSQGLDKRFNKNSVEFMETIFTYLMKMQNEILLRKENLLKSHFTSIDITDSSQIILPEEFKKFYIGSGGSSSQASLKIQLQYELLTGAFKECVIKDGISTDTEFLPTLQKNIKERSLNLKDLGYFKLEDLKEIHRKNAYYISKLKNTATLYKLNEHPELKKNGEVKKSTQYIKIDIEEILNPLTEGETIEFTDIYIGNHQTISSRVIVTKLTKECKRRKEKKLKKNVKKKKVKNIAKAQLWNNFNIYITNVPDEILSKEQIHDIYSLRWQIELMFKIWKSFFMIDKIKKVKIYRFKCFLYGRLISLLLTSSIVFTARKVIETTNEKEISEMKSFSMVQEFFPQLRRKLFKNTLLLRNLLKDIFNSIAAYGLKSKRGNKKTVFCILEGIKYKNTELEKLAS